MDIVPKKAVRRGENHMGRHTYTPLDSSSHIPVNKSTVQRVAVGWMPPLRLKLTLALAQRRGVCRPEPPQEQMIDPPYRKPHSHVKPPTACKRCAHRCIVLVAVLLTLWCTFVLFIFSVMLHFNMLPPAGATPLILLDLQGWPMPEPGGVCPGSASAYRLDEAWIGGSSLIFFDSGSWNFMHGTADPTGGPTQYVDHATSISNGLIEEGDGWAVIRAGRPVRPETSELVPAMFQGVEGPQMRQSVRMTSKRSWHRFLLSVKYTHLPYGCGLWPAVWFWCADVEPKPDGQPPRCPAWPVGPARSDETQPEPSLGSAGTRLLRQPGARLVALGGSTLSGRESGPLSTHTALGCSRSPLQSQTPEPSPNAAAAGLLRRGASWTCSSTRTSSTPRARCTSARTRRARSMPTRWPAAETLWTRTRWPTTARRSASPANALLATPLTLHVHCIYALQVLPPRLRRRRHARQRRGVWLRAQRLWLVAYRPRAMSKISLMWPASPA